MVIASPDSFGSPPLESELGGGCVLDYGKLLLWLTWEHDNGWVTYPGEAWLESVE